MYHVDDLEIKDVRRGCYYHVMKTNGKVNLD